MGDFMTKQNAIQIIPKEINRVFEYIDYFVFTNPVNNTVLKFSNVNVDSQDRCVLKISNKEACELIPLKILSDDDYLFYQQLLVSILDHYLKSISVRLTHIYFVSREGEDFYFLYLLLQNHENVNIQIYSSHDLSRLIEYYNEQVEIASETKTNELGGAKK